MLRRQDSTIEQVADIGDVQEKVCEYLMVISSTRIFNADIIAVKQ